MAVHGAAAPAHQCAPRFLRAPRPVARPEAGERARAARGPVAPRAQRPIIAIGLKMAKASGLMREGGEAEDGVGGKWAVTSLHLVRRKH